VQYFLSVLWWLSSAARRWQRCWLPSLVFCLALANHGGQAGDPFLMWACAFWSLPPKTTQFSPLQVTNSTFAFIFFSPVFGLFFVFPYILLDGWPYHLRSVLHLSSSTAKLLALSFFFRSQKLWTRSHLPAFHSIPICPSISG